MIVRQLQDREKDLTNRQEFQMQKLQERDMEYHDLLTSLKQRVSVFVYKTMEI